MFADPGNQNFSKSCNTKYWTKSVQLIILSPRRPRSGQNGQWRISVTEDILFVGLQVKEVFQFHVTTHHSVYYF